MMKAPISEEDHERDLVVQDPRELQESGLLQELVALERQRLDITNRRTEIAHKVVEAADAADKRQYDYHVEKLRRETEERKERRRSIFKIVWAMGVGGALVGALLLLMLFFGTDAQRETAAELLRTVLTGLGGAGVLWLLRTLFEWAMNQSRDDS